jgi:hypothetical protein
MLAAFLLLTAGMAEVDPSAITQAVDEAMRKTLVKRCTSADDEILVCGAPRNTYRVDPVVMAIERELAEGPPRPALDASNTVAGSDCIGPRKCGDEVLPLVQLALAALRAATLAAKGEDWKDAFRSRPLEYQRYLEQQARARKRAKVEVTIGAKP